MMSSFNPLWESTALAIVGKCPPVSARPREENPMSSSLVKGSARDGVDTVTCKTLIIACVLNAENNLSFILTDLEPVRVDGPTAILAPAPIA